MNIQYFSELASTNQYCELLDFSRIEEFTVICARAQTLGKGQHDHQWESQPGKNLTFSLILHPWFLPFADQFMLTKVLSLGLCDCLHTLIPEAQVHIKWPNDIYVGKHKICGILVSNRTKGDLISSSICGIGLNVNQTHFPSWVPNPTSLALLSNQEYELEQLLEQLLHHIETRYHQLQSHDSRLNTDYLLHLMNLHTQATYLYQGSTIQATIEGITSYGHLQLRTSEGELLTCAHGEITFL